MTGRERAQLLAALADGIASWEPRGGSVELTVDDRRMLREQLVEHALDRLELDAGDAERFYVAATSPLVVGRVVRGGQVIEP